jgi:hypothetical protein
MVEKVTAYYTALGATETEKYFMFRIDYNDAKKAFPAEWSLDAPKKGTVVVDKIPDAGLAPSPGVNPAPIVATSPSMGLIPQAAKVAE